MKKPQIPSKFQQNIYNEIKNTKNSLGIQACAGSGKTTTIINCLDLISPNLDTIMLAFNRDIKEELKLRAPSHVTVSTLHGFGCRMIFMNLGSKIAVVENKVFNLGCKLFDSWKITIENKYSYVARVAKIVDFMRFNLCTEDDDLILEMAAEYGVNIFGEEIFHAKKLLEASNKKIHEQIDFVDMIYLPAVKNFKIKKYHFVIIDELQDLSRAQQEMLKKMIQPKGGRFMGVGDPNQSIYHFMGADSDSFDRSMELIPNIKRMPLSITYRLTKALTRHAQELVPDIEFHEDAEEGVEPRDGDMSEVRGKDFVVCRNTKPLIILYVYLLKKGVKVNILGKEIGNSINNLIDRTRQKTVEGMLKHLGVHRLKIKRKLLEKGVIKTDKHPQIIEYDEKVEIITILAERFSSVKLLKEFIDKVFLDKDVPGITLSTIHKTKGLEADRVFILLPNLIPSQYATTPKQLQQEQNLLYVARTRAKKELIYIRDFNLPKEKSNNIKVK